GSVGGKLCVRADGVGEGASTREGRIRVVETHWSLNRGGVRPRRRRGGVGEELPVHEVIGHSKRGTNRSLAVALRIPSQSDAWRKQSVARIHAGISCEARIAGEAQSRGRVGELRAFHVGVEIR